MYCSQKTAVLLPKITFYHRMRRFVMPHCLRVVRYMLTLRICLCLQGKLYSGVGIVRTVGLIIIGPSLSVLCVAETHYGLSGLSFTPIVDGLRHTETSTMPCILCVGSRSCARTQSSESFQLPASSCIHVDYPTKRFPCRWLTRALRSSSPFRSVWSTSSDPCAQSWNNSSSPTLGRNKTVLELHEYTSTSSLSFPHTCTTYRVKSFCYYFHIIFHHVLDARVVCWICFGSSLCGVLSSLPYPTMKSFSITRSRSQVASATKPFAPSHTEFLASGYRSPPHTQIGAPESGVFSITNTMASSVLHPVDNDPNSLITRKVFAIGISPASRKRPSCESLSIWACSLCRLYKSRLFFCFVSATS